MLNVHHNTNPRDVWVSNSFLTAGDNAHGCTKGKLIGLSFYPGSVPTFTVELSDGALFNYVPPDKCWAIQEPTEHIVLSDLCYRNCPNENLCVHSFDFKFVYAYLKWMNAWFEAEYICTVDWYTGNDSLHLLVLQTGHFAWLPNHKINLRSKTLNPTYKKVRGIFSVRR